MSKPETARSYKGSIIDDNAIISLNIKWLIQVIIVCAAVVYGYLKIEYRIQELERGMIVTSDEIETLISRHIEEEAVKLAKIESDYVRIEEELKWYQTELNLNPFSWKKKKKK